MVIWNLDIYYCFEFRVSRFGFRAKEKVLLGWPRLVVLLKSPAMPEVADLCAQGVEQ